MSSRISKAFLVILANVNILIRVEGSSPNKLVPVGTSMSSTHDAGLSESSHCVDNDLNGNWYAGKCCHTSRDTNSWLKLDLGAVKNVKSVKVTGRYDYDGDQSRKIDIKVSVTDDLSEAIICAANQDFYKQTQKEVNCETTNIQGQYVWFLHEDWMVLCETEVFGTTLTNSVSLSPSSGPTSKFSNLPTSMLSPRPTTLPTTLMNTLKSYNVTLDEISFNSSSFTLSTKFRTSDISNTTQSKMTLMDVGCNLTYRGEDPVLSVTDAIPVILQGTTSLKGNILEAEFQIDKFALASSLLTSSVGEYEKSTVGELKFCLKTEILSGTKSVNFRESDVVLKYNLSMNSFSVLGNTIEKLNIVTSNQIASNIYSISTCRCSIIGYGCLDAAETSQPLDQDSLIHICLSPNSSDVKIALFNMHFSKQGSNQIDFVTVTNSLGVTGFSVVRGNGVLNAPLKVTSRLFTELFANGANTFDARGDAFLKFHSSTRKLLSHVSGRNLQQDGADAGSALYKMSVPITKSETSEVDYKKGKFTILIVGGFFTLVVLIALVTYKKFY